MGGWLNRTLASIIRFQELPFLKWISTIFKCPTFWRLRNKWPTSSCCMLASFLALLGSSFFPLRRCQDPKLRSAAKLFGLKWRAEWLKIFEHGMEDARPIWTDGWQHLLRNQQRIKFDIEDIFHFSTCTDRCGCWILLWYNLYVHVANIRTYIYRLCINIHYATFNCWTSVIQFTSDLK